MRPVLAVAALGIGLFGAGIGGVGRVDQQVAAADQAQQQLAKQRGHDCPWRDRERTKTPAEQL
jgi:hypothetical protein